MSRRNAGITEAQFALLFPDQVRKAPARKGGPRKPRVKRRKEDLPENVLEGQIKSFLEVRGWSVIRNHVGRFIPLANLARALGPRGGMGRNEIFGCGMISIGTKGDPDWTASRPIAGGFHRLVFDYEVKAPGQKLRPEQRECLERRAACGFRGAWFDAFEGNSDTAFVPWYRERFGA